MQGSYMEQALRSMARPSIRLTIGDGALTGAARFGGVPDVPPDFQWPVFETATFDDDTVRPRPLAFLAQFDCRALAPLDPEGLLPKAGLLSFFYELGSQRWGFDPADGGCARVFWFPEDDLAPATVPEELDPDYRLPPLAISLTPETTFPGSADFFAPSGGQGDYDAYWAARTAIDGATGEESDGCCSRLLGWPDAIQGNMTVECALVGRGIYMGGDRPIPQAALEAARQTSLQDWRLLFQLDTVSQDGFELMFGDCGRIYFYIRNEDLAQRRFDRCWLVLQCG